MVIPTAQFRNLVLFDRDEIEQMREARGEILEYAQRRHVRHAHNVLVFGEPGSGKSFAIKELLKSLPVPDISTDIIEINLSSIADPDQLWQQFHRARDISISGKIPVIFFDEFESRRDGAVFGWAQQFLAPMWDMQFVEKQRYSLGKSILIFAGSRFDSVGEFIDGMDTARKWRTSRTEAVEQSLKARQIQPPTVGPDGKRNRATVAASQPEGRLSYLQRGAYDTLDEWSSGKALDFKSRITTSIDIQGVNPKMSKDAEEDKGVDTSFLVKRALILRSTLEAYPSLKRGERLNIQPSLIDAFLGVPTYLHGARSIEQIVLASTLQESSYYDAVAIPSDIMLRTHSARRQEDGLTEFGYIIRK